VTHADNGHGQYLVTAAIWIQVGSDLHEARSPRAAAGQRGRVLVWMRGPGLWLLLALNGGAITYVAVEVFRTGGTTVGYFVVSGAVPVVLVFFQVRGKLLQEPKP
jgi:hypothetical protein